MEADKQLVCVACGQTFDFTVGEQTFFAERGFQEPRKCKSCRQAQKQQKRFGNQRAPRQLFTVMCAACGIETQVPFQPDGSRPVYCRDCYQDVAPHS